MVLIKIIVVLYTVKQKSKNYLDEKNAKRTKRSHPYRGNAEILNSFSHELQLKDALSVVKNKLIDLLSELRGFIFVRTLFLEFSLDY